MQKTEHYGLNLWELSDRIQMEDFNRDNTKLDAALAALAGGKGNFDILVDTFSEDDPATLIGRPFWDWAEPTHWDEYSAVLIMATVTKVDEDAIPYAVLLSKMQNVNENGTLITFEPGGFLYILMPMKDPARLVEGFFLSGGKAVSLQGSRPFSEIESFRIGGKKASSMYANVRIQHVRAIGIR